jgi:hypothetical protein
MTAHIWIAFGIAGAVAVSVASTLVNDEIRGWIDMLPKAILRFACCA